MPDIPYGDCFTVEARWDVCPTPSPDAVPRVSVRTSVKVSFGKSTIWRKPIEAGVLSSCKALHTEWLEAANACVTGRMGHGPETICFHISELLKGCELKCIMVQVFVTASSLSNVSNRTLRCSNPSS